jgi:hypothetical protein
LESRATNGRRQGAKLAEPLNWTSRSALVNFARSTGAAEPRGGRSVNGGAASAPMLDGFYSPCGHRMRAFVQSRRFR